MYIHVYIGINMLYVRDPYIYIGINMSYVRDPHNIFRTYHI